MPVTTDRHAKALIITLSREGKRNAIDEEMALQLDEALNILEDDPELTAGILTGGQQVFSAGSDLRTGSGSGTERGGEYGIIRRRRNRPLIAAVEGLALGGGMEIVLCCDIVVASSDATFGLPEVRRGLLPLYGGLFRPVKALPINIVKELLVTGDSLSAERAYALGFANYLTPPGEALSTALALAGRIAESAPVSVRESLAALERYLSVGDELGWSLTSGAADIVFHSADAAEGRNAFMEKRPPRWQGR